MNILVCDDDREIVRAIQIYLENEGYRALTACDGLEALEVLQKEEVHLVIMDVMMPRLDGISAVAKIRSVRNIPIIILSARSENYDKINGLNAGADDYVTKPFDPMELMARVRSQLRRYTDLGSMGASGSKGGGSDPSRVYRTGGLLLDDAQKLVTVDGEPVDLTPKEFGILKLLISSPGQVFSPGQIYQNVWNEEAIDDSTIAVHVRHIRQKIEIDPKNPRYLRVVWGVGYKVERLPV